MNEQQYELELLKKREAAAKLRIGLRTLDALISRQMIPYIKIGRLVRFLPGDLEKFIETRRIESANLLRS